MSEAAAGGGGRRGAVRAAAIVTAALALAALGNLAAAWIATAAGDGPARLPHLGDWKIAQFLFDYRDLGFAKRALLGTLLDAPNDAGITPAMRAVAAATGAALAGLLAWLVARAGDTRLAMVALLSPALFLQIGHDLGRLDQAALLVAAAILASARAWALLAAPVMPFIHEGSAVTVLPVLLALHWALHRRAGLVLGAGAASGASVAALFLLPDPPTLTRLVALYPEAHVMHLAVQGATLADNTGLVLRRLLDQPATALLKLAAAALYGAGVLVFALRLLGARRETLLALAAALAPLALLPVGIDWARWIALSVTNALLVCAVLGAAGRPLAPPRGALDRWLPRLLALAALAGPMGVDTAFPLSFPVERMLLGTG